MQFCLLEFSASFNPHALPDIPCKMIVLEQYDAILAKSSDSTEKLRVIDKVLLKETYKLPSSSIYVKPVGHAG